MELCSLCIGHYHPIIEFVQTEWKDVPSEDRGPVFDMVFARAIKRMYMIALREAYAMHGKSNSPYKYEIVLQLAHDIIAEIKANPPESGNTYDQGFINSFWDNALGDAYSILGYHHLQSGEIPSVKTNKAQKHFNEAAKYYIQAAEAFPKDD